MRLDLTHVDWHEPKVITIIAVLAVIFIGLFMGQIVTGFSYKIPIVLASSALIYSNFSLYGPGTGRIDLLDAPFP